jgi:hypothetical protein
VRTAIFGHAGKWSPVDRRKLNLVHYDICASFNHLTEFGHIIVRTAYVVNFPSAFEVFKDQRSIDIAIGLVIPPMHLNKVQAFCPKALE